MRDFMNYLTYIEHAAENLQFFLWYRDYANRFNEAKTPDIGLAPEWTQAQHVAALQNAQIQATTQKRKIDPENAQQIFQGTDFEKAPKSSGKESKDPFVTPPRTPAEALSGNATILPWDSNQGSSEKGTLHKMNTNAESYHQLASETFAAAGLKQPCMYT